MVTICSSIAFNQKPNPALESAFVNHEQLHSDPKLEIMMSLSIRI